MDHTPPAIPTLDLAGLATIMHCMLPDFVRAMAYAAAVCLEEQGHGAGTVIWVAIKGGPAQRFTLYWPQVTPQAQLTWADPEEATEFGACAVAALLVQALTGLTVVERARRGTGFDYWLGPTGSRGLLFQGRARLEVSGIRRGEQSVLLARERAKLAQMARGQNVQTRTLQGIVVIVEFGTPRSRFTQA